MTDLSLIFDYPCLDPVVTVPFKPFAENWLAGPVPAHWAGETAADLALRLTGVDSEQSRALVEFGALWLDDRPCLDPDRPLSRHRDFRINPPVYGPLKFYESAPQRIIFEDADLLIYNKEAGRPSQGVPHDAYNNVLSGLGRLRAARGDYNTALWLLHRLDADTSGLLMLAKNKVTAGIMGRFFQQQRVMKEYLCLGLGETPAKTEFEVKALIAKEGRRYVAREKGVGLAAHTDFTWQGEVLAGPSPQSRHLFTARPRTGRTHQIRLHLALAGWPISGDRFYGRPDEAPRPSRLMLAAVALSFSHPRTQVETTVALT